VIVTFKNKANFSQVKFSTSKQIETKIEIIISRLLEGKYATKGRNVKVSF